MAKRTLGVIAMIFGVLGIAISLLLIWPVWVGHGAVTDGVSSLEATVNSGMEQVSGFITDIETSLTNAQERVGQLTTEAQQLAQNPNVDERAAARLVARLEDSVGARYVTARESYVSMRERINGLRSSIRLADRLIPGIDLPELQFERLEELDSKLQDINTTLVGIRTDLLDTGLPVTQLAQRIATGTQRLGDRVDTAIESVSGYNAQVEKAQSSLASAASSARNVTTLVAVLLTLLCLYFALLHVGLFGYGYRWFRPKATVGSQTPEISDQQALSGSDV
jgi:predicted PurR-regulated permease PerM